MARKRQKRRKASYPKCCGRPMKLVRIGKFDHMKCLICGDHYSARGKDFDRQKEDN